MHRSAVADHLDVEGVAVTFGQRLAQVVGTGDDVAADTDDQVADLDPGVFRSAVLDHLADQHTGVFATTEMLAQLGRRFRQLDAETRFVGVPEEGAVVAIIVFARE